jgi:cystathionine gamma-synthase
MLPYAVDTTLAQGSGEQHDPTGAIVPPIHLATTFRRPPEGNSPAGWSYSRYGYPGLEKPEAMLKTLEGAADCRLFSSGMSAMTAVVMALRPGDHCVFPIDMYYGLKTWLKAQSAHWGMRIDHVDMTDPDKVRAAVISGVTRLVWLETPSNPHWQIYDIAKLAEIAHRAGARLVVDNTVATPILTQPIKLGADIVVHSATKYLNGHSDVLAGATLTAAKDKFWERIVFNRDYQGGVLGQFQSYLLMRGMRTLHLRVARSCESAAALADALMRHPKVKAVFYPGLPSHPGHALAARQMTGGFGGMLSIVVAGGVSEANQILARTRIWQPATSLGGVESLIERREANEGPDSHVDPGLLRLSVGIEATADLIGDLFAALDSTNLASDA